MELRTIARPRSPLRLPRGEREGTARVRGGGVERLIHLGDAPVVLRAAPAGGGLGLAVTAPDAATAARGMARLRHWTGVDDDLAPFIARFRDDRLIGASVRAAPHVRPSRRPMPFEMLMWAICEQLVTDERAMAIKRALMRAHARRDPASGLADVPAAATVAALSPAELQRCGLNAGRSRTLIAAAREVASGRVDLDGAPGARAPAARRLGAIPGIGSWTLAMLALHGHGDLDAIPAGDHAYRMLVGRATSGRPDVKASEEEVLRFVEPYRGWRALAGAHLLRVGAVALMGRTHDGAIARASGHDRRGRRVRPSG